MTHETNITYQILQPTERVPQEEIPVEKTAEEKVVSVETEEGPGLLFAEPEELRDLSPVLDKFRVHGVVIPDYVFLELVSKSSDLDCTVSDVEFSDPAAAPYKSTVQHLIKAGDNTQLREFLQQIKKPISAIQCDYTKGNVHTTLSGSGFVTLKGDKAALTDFKASLLKRLTVFLSNAYQASY